MAYQEKQLQEISRKFQIYGEILHAETLKIGHINETYTATYDQGGTRVRYIHQKINQKVFRNPEGVMKNVMRVTTHIRKKLEQSNVRDVTRRSLIVWITDVAQYGSIQLTAVPEPAASGLLFRCELIRKVQARKCPRPSGRSPAVATV